MKDNVCVAAVNTGAQPGDEHRTFEEVRQGVQDAAGHGAELVLFPELSLTGFLPNHPTKDHDTWLRAALQAAHQSAQALDGSAVQQFIQLAKESRMLLCGGLLEDAGRHLFNTQVLVGPDGLLGYWRKMHIPMYEMPFYIGGGEPLVADTPLGRIGVNICFDALFPESTRLLALQNAELVLFPFAADPDPGTVDAWYDWSSPAVRARCQENGVFGLACNYRGHVECCDTQQTFPGGHFAVDPTGAVSRGVMKDGCLVVHWRQDELQAARAAPEYLFRFRRPELYKPLVTR